MSKGKAAERDNLHTLVNSAKRLLCDYTKLEDVTEKVTLKEQIIGILRAAVQKGSLAGIWQLANMYEEDLLNENDLRRAINMYVQSSTTGPGRHHSLTSLHHLVVKNELKPKFEESDEQTKKELGLNAFTRLLMVEELAMKKHDEAVKVLAKSYRDGTDCEENLQLSQYWFDQLMRLYEGSYARGNVDSLWKLGILYLKGYTRGGIDLEKAASCLKKAAEESQNTSWLFKVAMMYLEGQLGDVNPDVHLKFLCKAIEIWEKTAKYDKSAYSRLGHVYTLKKSDIRSISRAMEWWSKGAHAQLFGCKLKLLYQYLHKFQEGRNVKAGLKILEEVASKNPSCIEDCVNVNYHMDKKVMHWIHNKVSGDNSSQRKQCLSILARGYNSGRFGQVNYNLSSKYFYQLFKEFGSSAAALELVQLHLNDCLPNQYQEIVRKWLCKLQTRKETGKAPFHYIDAILLGTVYRNGKILPQNLQQAHKWLLLPSYMDLPEDYAKTLNRELQELSQLPLLTKNEKQNVVLELSALTENMKNYPHCYRHMSRIMGDVYSDGKFVKRNVDSSVYWYAHSAESNSQAAHSLAKIKQNENLIDAVKLYKLSARLGNKEALNSLHSLLAEHPSDGLSSFLKKYKHTSLVPESELQDIKPLRNLRKYPKTVTEMHELGVKYLTELNNQEAAYWFRKCMKKRHVSSAVELAKMYKTGALGENLKSVSDHVCFDILSWCISKCKNNAWADAESKRAVISYLEGVSDVLEKMPSDLVFEEVKNRLDEVVDSHELNYDILNRCSANWVQLRQLKNETEAALALNSSSSENSITCSTV